MKLCNSSTPSLNISVQRYIVAKNIAIQDSEGCEVLDWDTEKK